MKFIFKQEHCVNQSLNKTNVWISLCYKHENQLKFVNQSLNKNMVCLTKSGWE